MEKSQAYGSTRLFGIHLGGSRLFGRERPALAAGIAIDHRAWKMQALEPHGAATMGLCRFPGDKVGTALAAIDTLMFSHASASPDGY
jgi:hypothetical protein